MHDYKPTQRNKKSLMSPEYLSNLVLSSNIFVFLISKIYLKFSPPGCLVLSLLIIFLMKTFYDESAVKKKERNKLRKKTVT